MPAGVRDTDPNDGFEWRSRCHPMYGDQAGVPDDTKPVTVSGDDRYGLDADGDGTGCDSA